MPDLDRYRVLQAKADKLRRDADRAAGALEEHMARLQTEHGVSSLRDAKRKLKMLTNTSQEADTAYRAALDAFAEKWEDVLRDDD